ncbi:hypothetical protein [Amycolatopsis magusensis]|uniref:hypothetical protein n=1 Tax=Amycolatopsis magusensis TaxID=882444 RepID=UPI00379F097A
MAKASIDTAVQDAFITAGLTRPQRSLLHTVLRALDSGSGLGFHAATSDSALVALIRAHDVLLNHAEHSQPQRKLLLRVLETSSACAHTALPIFPAGSGHAELQAALAELAATRTLVASLRDKDVAQLRAVTRARATVLEPLISSVTDAVAERQRTLWAAAAADVSLDARATAEIAVSVQIRGRDREALKHDLIRLLTKQQPTAAKISALLWPPLRCHHVTVLISGARSLDALGDLLPGARQWPITVRKDGVDGWPKSEDLTALLEKLTPITRASVLVRVPVDAADLGTAVVLGRRAVSEALDQYMAGNRIADLTLAGPWQVTGPNGRTLMGETVGASVRRAAPLSSSWSEGLRPALRIAHVAQRVEAPMTSAALCWSAIEATGLDAKQVARLARVCAIQTLRQQIIDVHAQLRLMVAEEVRRLGVRVKKAKDVLKRAEGALSRRSLLEQTTPADIEVLNEAVARARQSWQDCDAAHERALEDTTPLMGLVDAHVPRTPGKPILTKPDRWLDLLLPVRDEEDPQLNAARRAVTTLGTFAGGLVEETILLWRERLAQPPLLATWLQEKRHTYHALLEWLYTTRNTAFHNGRFAGPLDIATAHAGHAIVDAMLEVLNIWHSTQHARGQAPTPPEKILELLAQRTDALSTRLSTATSCHRLSIGHISGPDEVYWSNAR